jgi:hypothetical protein
VTVSRCALIKAGPNVGYGVAGRLLFSTGANVIRTVMSVCGGV